MGATVVGSVEMPVEFHRPDASGPAIRLLGPLTVERGDIAIKLPASRKVRALFAYLALSPNPVTRSQLCELLWDVPNDPRGELRWCLSKIRSIIDEPARQRVITSGDTVRIDLSDCATDTVQVAQAVHDGLAAVPVARLRVLVDLFRGDFLEDVDVDRNHTFNNWLTAQRRRFRACHTAILEHAVQAMPEDEAVVHLDRWLELSPFDQRVHEILLRTLARRNRIREGEEHVVATIRLFEAEGLDPASIRELWRVVRAQPADGSAIPEPVIAATPIPAAERAAGRDILPAARRASIAVMPFTERGAGADAGGSAGGLAHDVITRLAKLRSLFIIAQGTVFALHERGVGPEAAGRLLNVDYVVSGSLQRTSDRIAVSVELAETRTARIVWAEVFNQKLDDAFAVLDEIGNRIVASIASEIETIERNRAILRPPSSLDAWEAYHRGLWHMYRFSKSDNERATHFFETSIRLDPTFSRAHAGLSFTHFQNAFQGWTKRGPETDRAYEAAGQSLLADDRDPAAHWAMGRALWLHGRHDQSIVELEQAIDLSPNFALGHYTLAFIQSQAGDPEAAIRASDHSRHLSPFDPLLFAMLASRAMALVRLKRFDEAADYGVKGAARPNAHAHILAIAAYSLMMAGRVEEARAHMAAIRKSIPQYGVKNLLTAMQLDPVGEALFRDAAKRLGTG